MTTKTEILNQAIYLSGADPILNIDTDTSKAANILKNNYDTMVGTVLEDADWVFAVGRYVLTPETATPAWGFSYQFTIPPKTARVFFVTDDPDNKDFEWQREGNLIVCDATKIYIKVIHRVEDVNKWSAGFVQSLALRLAAELAIPIVGSKSLRKDLLDQYVVSVELAKSNDGRQGRSEKFKSNRYVSVR